MKPFIAHTQAINGGRARALAHWLLLGLAGLSLAAQSALAAPPSTPQPNDEQQSVDKTLLPSCTPKGSASFDQRNCLNGSFHVGYAVDTFASSEANQYLNGEQLGKPRYRFEGGFNFDYRTWYWRKGESQLWLYGETDHGVRSADLECGSANTDNAELCAPFTSQGGSGTLAAVLNASTLEVFTGLRYELFPLKPAGADAGPLLYLKGEVGVINIAGLDRSIREHKFSVGLIAPSGSFAGSYFDVGFGQSDLFIHDRTGRLKIDGFLTACKYSASGVKLRSWCPYAQLVIDNSLGEGADSIQSYIGVEIDFRLFMKLKGS